MMKIWWKYVVINYLVYTVYINKLTLNNLPSNDGYLIYTNSSNLLLSTS